MPSNLATCHADTLRRDSCEQIIDFLDRVVALHHDGMTVKEIATFRTAADSLQAIIAMQSHESCVPS